MKDAMTAQAAAIKVIQLWGKSECDLFYIIHVCVCVCVYVYVCVYDSL